jgi:hypothetical protein
MTIEAHALKTAVENFTKNAPDFGSPLTEVARGGEATKLMAPAEMEQLVNTVADSLISIRERFRALAMSPEAHQFAAFFGDCREQASCGEPAYQALFGERIMGR